MAYYIFLPETLLGKYLYCYYIRILGSLIYLPGKFKNTFNSPRLLRVLTSVFINEIFSNTPVIIDYALLYSKSTWDRRGENNKYLAAIQFK